MQTIFYDTCGLLNELQNAFRQPFLISSITLQELEDIKSSGKKDEDVKYRARKAIRLLSENEDTFNIIPFKYEKEITKYPFLQLNNDSRIILTAYHYAKDNPMKDIVFYTQDLCCYQLMRTLVITNPLKKDNLGVEYLRFKEDNDYTGFEEISLNNENMSIFYSTDINSENMKDFLSGLGVELKLNEYLILKNDNNVPVDAYIQTKDGLSKVTYHTLKSKMFNKTKGKDIYQQIAIDSLRRNTITMIRGAAGTGKSYLSMCYLMEQLEEGNIDKIIIFCNTVATSGSAKLGFYPGTRDEKLLDSQIGNFLNSKLGGDIVVDQLIREGKILLLPMSDIRGYDTTGMRAGIYISEAQNLDIELMRLALQRIGDDSICILDGDSETQVDLPIYAGNNNGMRRVSQVFRGQPCYGEVTLQNIHRSEIARLAQLL